MAVYNLKTNIKQTKTRKMMVSAPKIFRSSTLKLKVKIPKIKTSGIKSLKKIK